ncbi:MAG: cupin domain-containing protein [Bryobacteraceae bacterium]|jgi:mannose-6-phosphate isomerase-like protein (cupin superfamily)
MQCSRRELGMLLPALATASAAAQKQEPALASRTYVFEDLPVQQNGPNRSRAILDGQTHTGYPIEMHATELAPGLPSHASHHHLDDELIMVRAGTVEFTIAGRSTTLSPGSVVYVSSNEEHSLRNAGTTRAHYFVVALGPKS